MRKAVVRRINDLLDFKCEVCPINSNKAKYIRAEVACSSCDVYRELRQLGEKLNEISSQNKKIKEEKKKMAKQKTVKKKEVKKVISIPLYVELSEKGMYDKDIAAELGVKPPALAKWKFNNKKEIEAEIFKRRFDMVPKEDYEKLAKENEELKKQLTEGTSSFTPVSDYEEAEEKVKQLEMENGILRGDIRELKTKLDNTINSCDEYFRQRNELEKELILLRELVAIHLQRG